MAGKRRGQKSQFRHGRKRVWSIKPVSALLERGVAKTSILAYLDRGVVNKISFSMAEKGHGKKSKFQHGCKVVWSI
jgi:hypothetical protein